MTTGRCPGRSHKLMQTTLKLGALPRAQQFLFHRLTFTREQFVLYGGTAVALLAGHRTSVDLDFFGSGPLTAPGKQAILRSLSLDDAFPRTQDAKDTLSIRVPVPGTSDGVLVSFFGGIEKPRFGLPCAATSGPRIASPVDLAGFKLSMAHQRNKEDDLADLSALLLLGETLPRAAAVLNALYPRQLSLHHAVASAAWFEGREASPSGALTQQAKRCLEAAVADYRAPERLSPQAARLADPGCTPAVIAAGEETQ